MMNLQFTRSSAILASSERVAGDGPFLVLLPETTALSAPKAQPK